MLDYPQLDELEAFAVFAEHLNLTHAARAIGLSQPALHARIKRLGEQLGAPLYRREGRALVLTEAGERTARFAREIRARVRDFGEGFREERARAPIELCAGEGALMYLLGPALRAFLRRHPLRVRVGDAEATLEAVASGRAHLGVLSSDADPDPQRLEAELVAETGFALAVPTKDPLAARARVSWPELAGRALVVPPPGRPHRVALEAQLPAGAEIAVEVGGWPLSLRLVALGVGVAVVNDFCRAPRGVTLVPFEGLPRRRYLAVRDPRRELDRRAEELWTRLVG
jgi:DNA-binding transcriptional LysR family regulator